MFYKVNTAIIQHFTTDWADETKVVIDNQSFDPASASEFVRLSIRHADSEQAAMGATKVTRTTGSVIVQVFVKAGTGIKRLSELSDKVRQVMQYSNILGEHFVIQFRAATPVDIGQQNGSSFYQVNVTIPYYFDAR